MTPLVYTAPTPPALQEAAEPFQCRRISRPPGPLQGGRNGGGTDFGSEPEDGVQSEKTEERQSTSPRSKSADPPLGGSGSDDPLDVRGREEGTRHSEDDQPLPQESSESGAACPGASQGGSEAWVSIGMRSPNRVTNPAGAIYRPLACSESRLASSTIRSAAALMSAWACGRVTLKSGMETTVFGGTWGKGALGVFTVVFLNCMTR